MLRRLLTLLLTVVTLGSIGLHIAAAQSLPEDRTQHIRNQVEQIISGKRTKVRVTLNDGSRKKGRIAMTRQQSFDLIDGNGRLVSISYRDVEKIEKTGSSNAGKTAIWAAVAAGVVVLILVTKRPGIGTICPLGCRSF